MHASPWAWPTVRAEVRPAACMRVLERLDAELSELGDQGRPSVFRQAAHLARLLAGADHPGRRAQEGS